MSNVSNARWPCSVAGPAVHSILAERAGVSLDRVACLVLKAVASGSIRVTDLARQLGVEVPTMSRHVANLTQAGYLLKTPDVADGRVSWVELTARAKDTIERLESERRLVLSKVFADWTRSDRDAFVDLRIVSRPVWPPTPSKPTTIPTDFEESS